MKGSACDLDRALFWDGRNPAHPRCRRLLVKEFGTAANPRTPARPFVVGACRHELIEWDGACGFCGEKPAKTIPRRT